MTPKKQRLDLLLLETKDIHSRQRVRALIMAGKVRVDDRIIDKPGTLISQDSVVHLIEDDHPYVSRGGLKLEKALQAFHLNPTGLFCLDVGASTGGFTDCLLQHGATHVFAVDVGYGQMAWKLRNDSRVTVIERSNIRYLPDDALPCRVDIVTIDVSFISLKIVVPAVLKFLNPSAAILALVKPQFEVGRNKVGKGGVVRDAALHDEVISELTRFFHDTGLSYQALVPSPIFGPKGNREFIMFLRFSDVMKC
ncbi:TlyA family RNA methyltransferase [Thermodesulfobacteriota bacterium]